MFEAYIRKVEYHFGKVVWEVITIGSLSGGIVDVSHHTSEESAKTARDNINKAS